jgi:hypothetical protein
MDGMTLCLSISRDTETLRMEDVQQSLLMMSDSSTFSSLFGT